MATFAAFGVLATSLVACGGENNESGGGARKSPGSTSALLAAPAGTVTVALDAPVATLDPAKGSTTTAANLQWALYDTLLSRDPDGTLVGGLASSWDSTPTSATFKLKTGVTCSDGTALTSKDVAASLNRFFAKDTAAPGLGFSIGPGNTATATAGPDGRTLTVKLTNPWSGILAGLAAPATAIVCPAGLAHPDSLATASQGTGPYVVKSAKVGVEYTLTRRADYTWGPKFSSPAGVPPQTLVYRVVNAENTAANLLQTGDLDIATFGGTEGDSVASAHGFSSKVGLQRDAFLVFNEAKGRITADPAVRKAIAQAIDRANLVNVLGNGKASEIFDLGQASYECYDESLKADITASDPDAAKAVLDGLQIKILGSTAYANGNGTTYIQAALNAAGAKAIANNVDSQTHASTLFGGTGDWDVTILGLTNLPSSILASVFFFAGAAPPNGTNVAAIANPAADAAYKEAIAQVGDASCAATTEMQRAYFRANDVVPIAALPRTVVFNDAWSAAVVKGVVVPGSIRAGHE